MKPLLIVLTCVLALGAGLGPAPPPRTPVLVELFTSEGCSSCPPADDLLARLATTQPIDTAQVIPLEFHVDYWDHLGWKDPFGSAGFSKRQQDYGGIFGSDKVYTPQMVVDGAVELVGSDDGPARDAIRKAAAQPHLSVHVTASATGDALRMSVEAPAATPDLEKTDIVVALAEGGLVSAVRRGENGGRTLKHSAVVRQHQTIGTLAFDPFMGEGEWHLSPGWQRAQLRVVAFLQGQKTRRVYGAAIAALK